MDKQRIDSYDLQYGDDQVVTPDGVSLYYETVGEGSPLTIVNNFFVIAPLWRNFTKQLARAHRIVTFDLRNQGASSFCEDGITFDSLVEDLKHVLDAAGIERTYLLGSSTSTLICRDFALKYPERVLGMVLVGPLFCPYGSRRRKFLTKSWLSSVKSRGAQGLFEHIFPLIYSDRTIETGGTPAYLALRERFLALNSEAQLTMFLNASLTTDDHPDKLRQLQCPVQLIAGEADFLSCPSSLAAACRLIPQAQMEIVELAGHVPYFEVTEQFESLVGAFIDQVEEQRNASERQLG